MEPETLEFSCSLYPQSAIEETATAYAELAEVEVEAQDSFVRVVLRPKVEIDDLSDHFANHALHLSIVQSRGANP